MHFPELKTFGIKNASTTADVISDTLKELPTWAPFVKSAAFIPASHFPGRGAETEGMLG